MGAASASALPATVCDLIFLNWGCGGCGGGIPVIPKLNDTSRSVTSSGVRSVRGRAVDSRQLRFLGKNGQKQSGSCFVEGEDRRRLVLPSDFPPVKSLNV